jgi:hypothetical protein
LEAAFNTGARNLFGTKVRDFMSLIASRHYSTGDLRFYPAMGLQQIFDTGLALLYRGDDLVHISANKDEYPVTIENIKSAKANRDRYMHDGIRYEPLPEIR